MNNATQNALKSPVSHVSTKDDEGVSMGDILFIDGFMAGYWGDEPQSDDPAYLEAYGRGYATAETESAIRGEG